MRFPFILSAGVVWSASVFGRGAVESGDSGRAHSTVSGQVAIVGSWTLQKPQLARAVAWLEAHPALVADGEDQRPAVMGQREKSFVPDLLVVPKGASVEFPNWDPYSHNVFSRSRAASFDLDRYPQGQSKRYQFNEVGVVQLFCNIHPKMRAVILVTPNSYFARADATGRFQIMDVPPGQYNLVVWHERCAPERSTIEVSAGSQEPVSVTLKEYRERVHSTRRRRPPSGVERGLGVKRERLDLPVVQDQHPAPAP